MKVLVTGGGGFLGAATVRALVARGDTAIAFDTQFSGLALKPHPSPTRLKRPPSPYPLPGRPGRLPHPTLSRRERDLISAGEGSYLCQGEGEASLVCVAGDITDLANVAQAVQIHKPDAIVHCAAIVGVLSSLDNPIHVVRVNIEGSLNVFEAMRLGGVRRCIHISSEEAYGTFRSDSIDETHPLDPVLPYGICKAAVEQLGRGYRDLHGLEVINLRPSWVYGPGLPRDRIPKNLVEAALAGSKLHIAGGAEASIDHTYVDDVVDAILKALDHRQHRYDAYNVGSGVAATVSELVAIVRELVPGAELSVGSGPYRHGVRIEMVRKGSLDVSRAAAEFGWRPRYDIRAGLAAYVKATREAQSLAPPP